MTGPASTPHADGAGFLSRHLSLIFWAAFAVLIAPWVWVYAQQATHSDLLWLVEALNRVMEGYKVSEFIYETNPPLNIFTYAIPVMIGKLTGMPVHYLLFAYTSGLVMLSSYLIAAILRGWPFLQKQDVMICVAFLILVNTFFTGNQFGERDQYTGLALIPFTLLQLALTYGLPYPKWMKWPVFLIGSVFILLKPHHGLIPTMLLVHRMIVQRRWMIFKDADFISLSIMTSLYIGFTWFFFHDFITYILPDVIDLYFSMQDKRSTTIFSLVFVYTILVIGLFPLMIRIDQRHRSLILFFLACGIMSIIPFYVQGMSFKYHLFPAYSFVACGLGMTIYGLLAKFSRPAPALFGALLLFAAFCFYLKPLNTEYPRHKDYAHLPLSKTIESCISKEDCRFFIFHQNMGIIHETAHYTGVRLASRFAALWFLPTLVNMELDPDTPPEKLTRVRNRFMTMMAEDFRKQRPEFAIINTNAEVQDHPFDFIAYFTAHPAFAQEWKRYEKTGSLELNTHDYFTGSEYDDGKTLFYDVYRRKPD